LIVVKFVEGSDVRLRGGELKSLSSRSLARVERALADWPGAIVSRAFSRPEEDLDADRAELNALGHDDLPDLNLFYHVRLPPGVDVDQAIEELMALEVVEVAYRAPEPRLPPVSESDQGYLGAAPGGLGAHQVWPPLVPGGSGSGITIADVEYCWDTGHEDLSKATESKILIPSGKKVVCPSPCGSDTRDHGTAVLGELIADRNSFGVTGISYSAEILMSAVKTCTKNFLGFCQSNSEVYNVADAINRASKRLQSGDVILVEQQADGPNYSSGSCSQVGLMPVEWEPMEYAAIEYATSRGVTVVEAAGNGEQNLDDSVYGDTFDRASQDSGAILVGAGAPPNYSDDNGPVAARSKMYFSNYGSRVDVQAWGRKVATTAASGLFSSGYQSDFGGTSSASPMVASAVAIVQAHRKALGQSVLTPLAVRDLLAGTGVRQAGTDGNIGPQVDIATAIRTLDTPPTITSAALAALGCKGFSSRQWITFQGTGFVLASRVTLNDGTTNYDIPADRTEYLDDQTPPRLRVCAGVSFASNWTAKVKNLTYQTSLPFAFTVAGSGPGVSLTATPASISPGGSATLSWSSTNATSCTASGGWSGSKATSGSQTVSPSGTTTYTLTCSGSSSSASDSETITVAGSSAPPLVLIDAFPETIAPGNSAGLAWATANATSCTASGGWSGSKPLTGSQIVNPSSTAAYTLTCSGPGGSSSDSQTVTVSPAPYVSVVARPEAISPGGSSTLFWATVSMSSCTASDGWSGSKDLSGTQTVSPSSTRTYTLTCTETSGGTSELVRNGAFTGTASEWSKTGSFFADSQFTICKSCPGYAYLSHSSGSLGSSNNLTGWISQNLSIPSSATSVLLSFWVSISTQETSSTAFDTLLVWLKDTSGNPIRTLVTLSNADAGGYRQVFANLTSERGRTVRLEFLGATDATLGTIFRVDDVSVVATLPGAQRSDSATLTVLTPSPPTVSLTASPDSIAAGESSTLSWSSSNVTSCTASGGWSGSKSTSGSQSVAPTVTTTYTLTCSGAGGSATASATVALRQPAPVLTLTATPGSILQGAASTLAWSASNATSCVAAGAWEGSRPMSGSETVAPQATSSYVLACQGPGGSATRNATVTVVPHTLTFTSEPSGSPNPVGSGGSVALAAQASDSHGHTLAWSWVSSCPGANGAFSSTTSRTPIWTAPVNATGAPFNCLISVTANDGQGLSATASHQQEIEAGASPGGGGCGRVLVQQPRSALSGCDASDTGMLSRMAENFRLADRRDVSCLEVLGYYWPENDPPPSSAFDVVFHEVAGDGTPGAVVHEEHGLPVQRQKTGNVLAGMDEWSFAIALSTPVDLPAGNYFVEIAGAAGTGGSFCWSEGQLDPAAGLAGLAYKNTGAWGLGTWNLALKVFERPDTTADDFYTVPPCRAVDTRDPDGAFGGPVLSSGATRLFTLAGRCGVPAGADAVALNVTAINATGSGSLTLFPGDEAAPATSSINFSAGQNRANNAMIKLSDSGTLGVKPAVGGNGQVQVTLDVVGYFADGDLAGLWQGSIAGHPSSSLEIRNEAGALKAWVVVAGEQPPEEMTNVTVSPSSFQGSRPRDNNAEIRLVLNASTSPPCLNGEYLELGTSRPIALCRVQ
jgi:hypothetical protein